MNKQLFPKGETRDCPRGYGIEVRYAEGTDWYVPYLICRDGIDESKVYKSFIAWNDSYYSSGPHTRKVDLDGTVAFRSRTSAVDFLFGFDWHLPPMPKGQLWRD